MELESGAQLPSPTPKKEMIYMKEKPSLINYLLEKVPAWVLNPQTPEAAADKWYEKTEKEFQEKYGKKPDKNEQIQTNPPLDGRR